MPLNVTTAGSAVQRQAELYHKQLHAWYGKRTVLREAFAKLSDNVNRTGKKLAAAALHAVEDSIEQWNRQFIPDHFNSYIALVLYNYRRDFPPDTLKKLFISLSPEIRQSKFGQSVGIQIGFPKPPAGDYYHDFAAITPQDDPFNLSSVKNIHILLRFAGSACYWSHASLPKIRRLSRQYRHDVSFVSYFIDSRAAWLNVLKRDSIDWPAVWSIGTKYGEPCSKYGVTGTPTFFLIGPDKKITAAWFGYEQGIIEKEITGALARKK